MSILHHTLGNDAQRHVASQIDDRSHDRTVIAVMRDAPQEQTIDLEGADGKKKPDCKPYWGAVRTRNWTAWVAEASTHCDRPLSQVSPTKPCPGSTVSRIAAARNCV